MGRLADRLLGRMDAKPLPTSTRVLQRQDGWTNPATGLGGPLHRTMWTRFEPDEPLTSYDVDALMRGSAMARRIVSQEPDDCTREGIDLHHVDPSVVDELHARLAAIGDPDQGGWWGELALARTWAKAYGGSAIILIVADNLPLEAPMGVGPLQQVMTVDRHSMRPEGTDKWWRAERWRIGQGGSHDMVVHRSRMLFFRGFRLTPREEFAAGGWGGSDIDLAWAELRNWSVTNDHAAEAVQLMTQTVFSRKNTDIAKGAGLGDGLAERAEVLALGLGLFGAHMLDMDNERMEVVGRPIAGIQEGSSIIDRALVAVSRIPRVILFGETPGGLHSGEASGEIRGWYSFCSTLQDRHYRRPTQRILDLLTAELGVEPAAFDWFPLWAPSEMDQANIDVTRASRREIDIRSGIVSPQEARTDADLHRHYDLDPEAEAPGTVTEEPDPALVDPVPQAGDPPPDPIDGTDAAELLGVRPNVIHRLAAKGAFPAWRVGGRWKYSRAHIIEHARKNVRMLPSAQGQ